MLIKSVTQRLRCRDVVAIVVEVMIAVNNVLIVGLDGFNTIPLGSWEWEIIMPSIRGEVGCG